VAPFWRAKKDKKEKNILWSGFACNAPKKTVCVHCRSDKREKKDKKR
jgi:hypothetical protein